jgi:signal transduction histidine kinase
MLQLVRSLTLARTVTGYSQSVSIILRVFLLLLVVIPVSTTNAGNNTLRIAIARSINNTSVVNWLVEDYQRIHPEIDIQLKSVGSLQALDLARTGKVDMVITHYPSEEKVLLKENIVLNRTMFMFSSYAVFGPPGDELGLLQESDIKGVMKKLASSQVPFISPSPQGGTYHKIAELWAIVGVIPDWPWYHTINTTPLGALRLAAEEGAYTIADIGTYLIHQQDLSPSLVPLYQGGYELQNVFNVLCVNPETVTGVNIKQAGLFREYMLSDRGQKVISSVNEKLFNAPVFYPAAHLDTSLVVERAESELLRTNRTLYAVSILLFLVGIMLAVTIHLAYRAKQLRKEQMQLEITQKVTEQANRAKSEFLSRMSHELRTPLNAIMGFSEVLEMRETDPQKHDALSEITRASHHLLALINEILDISKIEKRHIDINLDCISLDDVVMECLKLSQPIIEQHKVNVNISNDLNHKVIADPVRLKEIILNLLSNAAKYNIENGVITISSELVSEKRVRLAITDTGPGISKEKQNYLFQHFERLGQESGKIEGTGIGLAISKQLVELMDGEIGVNSAPGQGSTFWIILNLA